MMTAAPICSSPLRLFLSDLLADATVIPEIVVDNARTSAPLPIRCMASPTSSLGLNHASQHSVHRWDTLDVSPTAKNNRKKQTTPSSFTSTSSSSTSSSTQSISSTIAVVSGTTSASTAPIVPPGRSSTVRGLPPKPSTQALRRDSPMLSSSAIPLVPIRHPSEDPSIASGGSTDSSLRSFRYRSNQSRSLVQQPSSTNGSSSNNSGCGGPGASITSSCNNVNLANNQEAYSPIRTLSPRQQLSRQLSATFAMLADATQSPILSPVRRLSRTLGIHHRQSGTTLSTVSSQPPTIPIRKPSKGADGTPLSPPYLPVSSSKQNGSNGRLLQSVNMEQVQQLQRRTSSILSSGSSSSSGSVTSKGSVNIQPPKRRMSTISVESSNSGTGSTGSGGSVSRHYLPPTGQPSALTRKSSVVYGSTVSTTSKHLQQQQEFTIIPEDNATEPPSVPSAPVVMPSPPHARTSPMSKIFQRGGAAKSSRR